MMHVACSCVAWNALRKPSLRGPEVFAHRGCGSKGFFCPFLGFDFDGRAKASTLNAKSISIFISRLFRNLVLEESRHCTVLTSLHVRFVGQRGLSDHF